ncbi:uncharacterized protein [Solanum tuberosum]|nr:PREDICTED: uncharacterized protein LOC102580705 [Solanum tuberosum]KAH0671844.1 hypothetical protein KY284_022931 [Solanum tuberosum]
MAMGHERSKPLHNFDLPCGLKWGNQKFLRCAKVDSNGEIPHFHRRSNGSDSIGRRMREIDGMVNNRRSSVVKDELLKETEVGFTRKFRSAGYNGAAGGGGGDGIAAVREKLMFDLQAEADKMKYAIFRDGLEEEVSVTPATAPTEVTTDVDASRPWNLRTRRAACKAPMNGIAGGGGGGGGSNGALKVDVIRNNGSSSLSPLRSEIKSVRLRSEFAGAGDSYTGEKRKRTNFSVSLGRREIEEDFMAMVGHRPPRRPKKRAKMVQKNLDTLFPGLWLTEITPDLYKVPDDQ